MSGFVWLAPASPSETCFASLYLGLILLMPSALVYAVLARDHPDRSDKPDCRHRPRVVLGCGVLPFSVDRRAGMDRGFWPTRRHLPDCGRRDELFLAPAGADLDADDAAGEADQDRGQSRPPRQGRDVPAGGGGGAPGVVRGDPGPDRSAASGAEPGMSVRYGRVGVTWSRGGRGWCAVRCGEKSRIGACGVHRGVRSGIGPAGRPDLADLSPGHGHSARVQ